MMCTIFVKIILSSALNAMIYYQGTIGSYKQWADIIGDQSWTFDKLLRFFAKRITYSPPNAQLCVANASVPPPQNPFAFNGTGPLHVVVFNTTRLALLDPFTSSLFADKPLASL
jgi:choline dehydrogenase-like flavoprotein